jgi:GDP-mannose 6-dehydrogenase
MSSSISILGMGYVGCVSAACFAHMGHQVTGVDIHPSKVEMLESGRSPIVESRMTELVAEGHASGRLHATTDVAAAVLDSDISFICVGTPGMRNGNIDLSHLERVSVEIGSALRAKKRYHTVVLRSTVLPGTTESLLVPTIEKVSGGRDGVDFAVCYNPEFMREGSAVADFLEPPHTIIGASAPGNVEIVRQLYTGIGAATFETTISVAEMVKYVSNTFHALKIDFVNEIGTLCKNLGVDTESVIRIFKADHKLNISSEYLSPGFAFGGSCLPKDLRALNYRAKELDLCLPLLESISRSNAEHLERATEIVLRNAKTRVAMLGLSFKAATDDLRESPHVWLVKRLLGEGRQIRIWDENVSLGRLIGSNRQYIEQVIPHIGSLLCSSLREALDSSEVIVIGTREVDPITLWQSLKPEQMVIDLVNLQRCRRPSMSETYEGICW